MVNQGLTRQLASARVCQDIILYAIANSPLNRNVTIKGGVVMRSLSNNNRRATRDIDLDFIYYSISDIAITEFIRKLNLVGGYKIEIEGSIEPLKHQDYKGKCIHVKITDLKGSSVSSKLDIGVHKYIDIEQDVYCFDVCMCDEGVSLLKNTVEQAFAEKLKSLLIFGANSRRYKDVYDLYFLKDMVDNEKFKNIISILIFDDDHMRENSYQDIKTRISKAFDDKMFLDNVSKSRQRWVNEDIEIIMKDILSFLDKLLD